MKDAIVEVIIPVMIALLLHEVFTKPYIVPQVQAMLPLPAAGG